MDKLSRLRGMMKEETFKGHGFTDEMRRNILNEIHSGGSKSSYGKKSVLAPVMTAVFMLACLTLFVYIGGSQLELFQGKNASQADFQQLDLKVDEDDTKWSEKIKLPSVVPFEVVDRTYKTTPHDGFDTFSIKLFGPEKQRLTISMDIGLESGTPAMYEPVKIRGVTGSYRENRELRTSHLVWYEDGIFYSMGYNPRMSDMVLDKADMVKIAESFQN
ncbi:hypothetical protein [Bacillus sp. Marseille-Q1617]|uniref:hypothetical protein n=1 Tax=Bacillus sp. Marseille-Q1617 TaxID=2736887 RepID=UPI0015886519|nr:hypothetical protein [Bacillus sp. Marseille-Q1617]